MDKNKIVFQVTEQDISTLVEHFGVPKEVINEQVLEKVRQRLTAIPVSVEVYWVLHDLGLYQKN